MKNIFRIINKNLKLLIRSRSSALIIILAPLLVILLVGIAFDNANAFGLSIGVYSPSFGPNVNGFLDRLAEKEFRIIKYTTEQSCVEDIKVGVTNTCIIFPPDLQFETNEQKEVTFYVDYSKINLVWMIMDTLSARFGAGAREISKNLTSVLISKLESSQAQLDAKKPIVAQLKSDAGEMQAKVQGVSSGLAALDLTYNEANLPIGQAKNAISTVRDTISSNLEGARSHISTAQSKTSDTAIIDELDEAITSIETAKSSINAADTPSLTLIGTLLTTIQNELERTKNKLTQASAARDSAVPGLTDVNRRLDQSIQNINSVETTLASIINDIRAIKVTDPEAIAEPIITEIKPITTERTYLNYLFPSLIILVVMFISILLGTTLVMMEKHSPASFRNFITPTKSITFIIAAYLTNMLLVVVQLVIIIVIAGYFFSAQILPSIAPIIGILLLSATFFTFWGLVMGYIFTSEETATLAAISTGSIFLFLSSVIIPLESMPFTIRKIAAFNPFVVSERVLREVILFHPKITFIIDDIALLTGYAIILFLFIWGSQKFISKHYLQKLAYYSHKRKKAEMQQRELERLAVHELKKEQKQKRGMFSFGLGLKRKEDVQKTVATSTPLLIPVPVEAPQEASASAPTPITLTTQQQTPEQKALEEELKRISDELRKMGAE